MAAEEIWPALVLVPALAVATVTDLRDRIVPNWLNLAALAAGANLCLAFDPGAFPARIGAAAAAGGGLALLALLRPGEMGMGDAKLAAVIGLCLGAAAAVGLLIAFALGAIAGLVLIARDGAPARRRRIPFAPFLAAGGLIGLVLGDRLLRAYLAGL